MPNIRPVGVAEAPLEVALLAEREVDRVEARRVPVVGSADTDQRRLRHRMITGVLFLLAGETLILRPWGVVIWLLAFFADHRVVWGSRSIVPDPVILEGPRDADLERD